MEHLVDLNNFSLGDVESIIFEATKIKKDPAKYENYMKGKILATLFFEPSTRTQFSFQTAMLRLGGQFIGFSNPMDSSVAKGESFKDTIKIMSCYADILAVRHFLEGAAFAASIYSCCPIINAGDGKHLHPTQTLTDLMTILQYKKKFSGLSIGICGDLKFGRTVRSLVEFLAKYKNNRFFFIPFVNFNVTNDLKEYILECKNEFFEGSSLRDYIKDLDVLYMTRLQKERFKNTKEIEKEDFTILNEDILKYSKKDLIIMHPLPKRFEIDERVDDDERAVYFEQAANGIFVRMALILNLFYCKVNAKDDSFLVKNLDNACSNENCITNSEIYLPKHFKNKNKSLYCEYCGQKIEE